MYKCRNSASKTFRSLFPRGLALGLVVTLAAQAAEPPAGILGKGGWLFYRYELSDASDASMADESLAVKSRLFINSLDKQIRFFCAPFLQSLNRCLVLQSPLRDMVVVGF
jgi:hypothetical protein